MWRTHFAPEPTFYNYWWCILNCTTLYSLSDRRFTRDVFLYSLINGHYNIDISDRLLFCKDRNVGYDLRKNDSLDLACMYSRTNSFKYSYFVCIIDEWKSLPNDIKETVGISSFKHKVMSFLRDAYT